MKIIGIDPGYAIVGYGVITYNNVSFTTLDYGAIVTSADMPFGGRLLKIFDEYKALLIKHKPDAVSVEKLFFTNNQKTGIDVAQARGIILLGAEQQEIPCFEYTPLQVKQAVVGYGRAEKAQVIEMTKRLLKLTATPKPDDTADALAVAICHAHASPSLLNQKLHEQLLTKSKW